MPVPKSWERVGVSRSRPDVDPVRTEDPGGTAATGSGDASWRRRLAPHHREIVRRYFGGDGTEKRSPAAGADEAEDGR